MDAKTAREYIYSQPRKQMDVATPFWPELDGHIAVQDIPASIALRLEKQNKGSDGQVDAAALVGSVLVNCLVLKDTGEPLFSAAERDMVTGLGLTVLNGIGKAALDFLGMSDANAASAKKN